MGLMIFASLFLIAVSLFLPNETLVWYCFIIFGVQAFIALGLVARNANRLKDYFLPTVFVLVYYSVNLTIGAYLVPRNYGFDKQFAVTVEYIRTYQYIVTYLIACNLALTIIAVRSLKKVSIVIEASEPEVGREQGGLEIPKAALYFSLFFLPVYFDIINAFSIQFAVMIVHLSGLAKRRSLFRYPCYLIYLAGFLVISAENKREIAMALFLVVFLELYLLDVRARFRARTVAAFAASLAVFFTLVIWASILRGYGEYPVDGPVDAVRYIPAYVTSEEFADGITDNLELNYNYGVTMTSIDYVVRGEIPYQLGTSFLKILYLPIPRQLYPDKPENVLQIFTKSYAPGWWAVGGSMPVMFAAEMFANFSFLGVLAFAFCLYLLDELFIRWHQQDKTSLTSGLYLFLVMTVLMLARGAAVDQYALYFFFSLPLFLLIALVRGRRAEQSTRPPEVATV